ncbi:hypothetical protein M409DRAFT_23072 [Zasmidium cellare ATCC 36951]|uniref:Enoyl reductase (ER) domain-containing protein n=1 Tax=Zasmidium cellare ATCC 36951 TaxID=1080233 RepID=A0A6A6CJV6_ZASCE|nr:uncharacterized protein M409DRAFT_23072 [Zasmidium cellare ATCC 36951]KAF2166430.1 hypothetical protein M409DRAFT_23072 [Zasmidium cellare ATCC 36951]
MSASQKAVFVSQVGKPLELGSRPIPSPQPGEVLVKVSVCMLLPHDAYSRDLGLFTKGNLPFVPASNVAGIISRIGSANTCFREGDRVFGYSISRGTVPGTDQGGLQEYAILDVDSIGKIPVDCTDEQAVTLPTNLVTAWQVLFTHTGFALPSPIAREEKGPNLATEMVLILGAGSNISKFAVQLARMAGIGTIIAVAGPSNQQDLLKMGATHFLDRHLPKEKLISNIHLLAGRDNLRLAFDTYSPAFDLAVGLLPETKSSIFRTTQPMSADQKKLFEESRPLCDAAFVEGTNASLRPHASAFWKAVPRWLAEGKLSPTDYRVIEGLNNVEEINSVLDGYCSGSSGPQVVVRI